MTNAANEYNASGRLVHEARAEDGERLDHYLARVCPDLGDRDFWYSECDTGRVEVRDHFDPLTGTYNGTLWFVRWYDGERWRVRNLERDERPRMRGGFCHIVKEAQGR
jgi:hypothetical protein